MYDKRGNILTLQRNGLNGGTFTNGQGYTAGTFGMIDNLTYNYTNEIKLTKITESSVPDKGFKSANTSYPFDYMYDANGNLIADFNKNILEIQYNYLNLPTLIRFKGGGGYIPTIEFVYDATGAKLRKIVKVTSSTSTILNTVYDYVGGVEYKNNTLERISNTEGAVTRNGITNVYEYEYALRDHLGNTRATFSDANSDGIVTSADIKQINHYYPFGLNMEGNWTPKGANGEGNKYQYNGKELNNDFGLNWNDYGRRFYDAAIGRFPVVDRFAEKYKNMNPYQYAANNPIKNIDINGDSILITHGTGFLGLGKKETLVYDNGKLSNRDGSNYTGKVKGFLKNTVSDLNKLSNGGSAGNKLVGFFMGTKNNVTIGSSSSGNHTNGTKVSFDTNSANGGLDVNGNTSRPTFVGLGHELFHAKENTLGKTDNSTWFSVPNPNDPSNPSIVPKADITTSTYENRIRGENGIPLRAYYTSSVYTGAELLNTNNTPKYSTNDDNPTVALPILSPQSVKSDN